MGFQGEWGRIESCDREGLANRCAIYVCDEFGGKWGSFSNSVAFSSVFQLCVFITLLWVVHLRVSLCSCVGALLPGGGNTNSLQTWLTVSLSRCKGMCHTFSLHLY